MSFDTDLHLTIDTIATDTEMSELQKSRLLQNISKLRNTKLNLMIVGGTGVGKSSTINALFGMEKAKIGTSSNPETMDIASYEFGNVILWDSPGLGDGKEADERHAKAIIKKLAEKDSKGELLIDMVLVILDGASRDLGTSYQLINHIIIPNLGDDKSRLLVAINKADMAMSGRNWDFEKREPQPKLIEFLDDKVNSTKERIKEATGVNVDVIYYSAGYTDNDTQEQPYNLSKLLAFILKHTKSTKRAVIATQLNQDAKMWEKSDNLKDYQKEVDDSIWNSVKEVIADGLDNIKDVLFNRVDNVRDAAKSIVAISKEAIKIGSAVGETMVEGFKAIKKLFW